MEKINIANLLKDCPTGYPLNCTMYEDVYFDFVDELNIIHCYIQYETHKTSITFNQHGTPHNNIKSKCVIFPKGKTTWEGFVPPFKFKDGDILFVEANYDWIIIYKENENQEDLHKYVATPNYANHTYLLYDNNPLCFKKDATKIRLATEEEKAKLFKAIKDHGYKWNSKTKTLEILIEPNFKVGDWVTDGVRKFQIHFITDTHYWYSENCILGSIESVDKQYHLWTINDAKDGNIISYDSGWTCIFKRIHGIWYSSYCFITSDGEFHTGYEEHDIDATINGNAHPATEEQCRFLFQKIKEAGYKWNVETKTLEKLPKYKVGDEITNGKASITIGYIDDEYYYEVGRNITTRLLIKNQDEWKLVPNKFNITTLKPFNKVLVRSRTLEKWRIQFFEKYDKTYPYPFICLGGINYKQCIPYECNEHLLDTANDCQEFYKNWE